MLSTSFAKTKRLVTAHPANAICACLLVVMAAVQLSVITRKSLTTDEIVMIPSAFYYLKAKDAGFIREHPPLSKILAASALPFFHLAKIPADSDLDPNTEWERLMRFWTDNGEKFERISFWARVPAIALTFVLGILTFVFARDLFGERAALFAVALLTLEPTVLAHGRVVQTDIPATFGYLLFFYLLRRYLKAPTWQTALALGLATGVALITKFSMVLTVPIVGVTFAWLLWRRPAEGITRRTLLMHVGIAAVMILAFINTAYLFKGNAFSGGDAELAAKTFPAFASTATAMLRASTHFLPTDFVMGIVWQIQHNASGHPAFLLGEYSRYGWWYYFPIAFALKTTLPFLLLSIVSLVWCIVEFVRKRDKRVLWLLVPFALYTLFVMTSQIDIGVRYYLPVFPFLCVAAGLLLDRLIKARGFNRVGVALTVVIFAWAGVEAMRAYPDHMSYLNELCARGQTWEYLSDSNIEWGEDVKGLALFLKDHGEDEVRATTLSGYLAFRFYQIKDVNLIAPDETPLKQTRYTAIGASFLNGSTMPEGQIHGRRLTEDERVNFFDEYRHRTPETIIGGSIYVFREHE